MPRRRSVSPDRTKAVLMRLPPELALCAAVLQQAVADLRSPYPDIRHDALQFLGDEDAVAWWGQQLGVEDALRQQVQAVLRDGR